MALGKIGSGVAALSMLATASSAEAQVAHAATIDTLDPTVVEQIATNYREYICLLYTSPSPRDKRQSRMPSSA